MSSVVETTDVGSTLALLADARGVVRIRPRGGQAGLRLAHDRIGAVGLDHVTFNMDFDVDVGPVDLLIVGQVNAGAVGFRAGETERWCGQGDIYLAGQPGDWRTSMARAGQHEQAVFDAALLSQIAGTGPGQIRQPVRFTGHKPVSAQAARSWKSTYAYIRNALADRDIAAQPLFTASAVRLLVAATLNAFPNNALTSPTSADRHDSHPATLRRAITFIDDNAHTGITVADIAAAAHVTIRAIQLAFRRHLDITPTEYLRRVRLDHAHRELVEAAPGAQATVTAIAYHWGFASPSRFAAVYRQAYGVTPSHTLHN